jgi:hypothetical protein
VATTGRTVIYVDWGITGTPVVWMGEPLWERSLGNLMTRIKLSWTLARIRNKLNWPRLIWNVFGVSDI